MKASWIVCAKKNSLGIVLLFCILANTYIIGDIIMHAHNRKLPSLETILYLYNKKGLSLKAISLKYNCSPAAVGKLLREKGLDKGHRKRTNYKVRGGYAWIRSETANNTHHRGFIPMYRYVMEKHLGRKLKKKETVHHIDLNKRNDNIKNLQLCTISEHRNMHYQLERLAGELVQSGHIYFKEGTYKINKKRLI